MDDGGADDGPWTMDDGQDQKMDDGGADDGRWTEDQEKEIDDGPWTMDKIKR